VSDVFPAIGLNSRAGVVLVYLGGALGVNAWLMKGFFDSIPAELDESARVDGATAGQIFWGVILPLGAPVLAVIGLLSFISTINEYVIVSRLLQDPQKYTRSVGLFNFVNREYGQDWGPFCAGVALMAIPVMVLFLFLQRFIVHGLTGGVKG
jgi:arabinogalactan oligomer/maltooligosaccharide transport system permease protein